MGVIHEVRLAATGQLSSAPPGRGDTTHRRWRSIAAGVEEAAGLLEFAEEGSAEFEVGPGEGAVEADPEADFLVFG